MPKWAANALNIEDKLGPAGDWVWPRNVRARLGLSLVGVVLSFLFAAANLQAMARSASPLVPFTDANTYIAAGERLNAHHDLYKLAPGDRSVDLAGGNPSPLFSPPPIAVLWRPLALAPVGLWIWVIGAWLALLGTAVALATRTGIRGALVVAVLSPAIGEQLAVANVAAFFPLLLAIAWRYSAMSGIVVGVMAVLKLAPIAMSGWLVGMQRWRQLVVLAVTVGAAALITVGGAGADSLIAYWSVAQTIAPSGESLSAISGIPWLSSGCLVASTIAAALIGRRSAAWSFVVALVGVVFGTPALYLSGLATLVAALVPLAIPARVTVNTTEGNYATEVGSGA